MCVLGRLVPMPDAVDAALLVAVHAATHDWLHLEAVAAMAAALAALDDRGWRILVLRSSAYGCRRRVGVAAALARDLDTAQVVALHICHRLTTAGARDWSTQAAAGAGGGPLPPLWLTRQLRLWRR